MASKMKKTRSEWDKLNASYKITSKNMAKLSKIAMANYFERKLSQETISSLTAILCHFNLEYCEYAEEIDTCFADMEHSENQCKFKSQKFSAAYASNSSLISNESNLRSIVYKGEYKKDLTIQRTFVNEKANSGSFAEQQLLQNAMDAELPSSGSSENLCEISPLRRSESVIAKQLMNASKNLMIGNKITIIPTYVITVEEFYGVICEPTPFEENYTNGGNIEIQQKTLLQDLDYHFNHPDKIYRSCTEIGIDDIVIVKTNQNVKHRAKVINILDSDHIKVLHLDYGFCSIVSLSTNVFCYEKRTDHIPFQAVRFRMDNVQIKRKNDIKSTYALTKMITGGGEFSAEVINLLPGDEIRAQSPIVTIRLYDKLKHCINNKMCSLQLAVPLNE